MSLRVAASASLTRILPARSPAIRGGVSAASRIHVLAIGGSHQFAHIVPVACELERRFPGETTVFVPSPRDAEALRAFARSIAQPLPAVVAMTLPAFGEKAIPGSLSKIARLLAWAKVINRAQVLLCAERTSTILPRLFPDCPPVLHIPHGAGDRAVGFERRFALFDHVLVAGRKDRDRLVESGVVADEDCTVTGPIKLSTVIGRCASPAPLFDNDRPTILYNPHFSPKYGSLEHFGRQLAEAVVRDGRYNLVIAPHMRLAQGWKPARRSEWESLAVPGRVIVDLGSERSCDMTYTLGADLYVGDVSSQVYEFLIRPRPCLFVDAHDADWQESEDYAMWRLGEVVKPECDPIAAIERALADHATYLPRQKVRMAYAIEGIAWGADGTPRLEGTPPASVAATIVARRAGLLDRMPLAAVA
ncbi:glycosyl transferase [Novosphingobium sp. BL-8A]|uniref:glycosyl transferase n=1 Tax=Novosphingobium sp. BL-8A TaxID=3127639 RepID=UPI003757EAD1